MTRKQLLIDQIYEAALDAERWPDVLTELSRYIGAEFMSVVPYDDPSLIYMSRGGAHAMHAYTDYWYQHDTMVRVGVANKYTRDLICDWNAVGLKKIDKDPFYQEYRRQVGIGHCIGSSFEAFPGDYRALGVNFPLGKRPLEKKDLQAIDGILRHAARAITITSRAQRLSATQSTVGELLECIKCGAAVVAQSGRILYTNKEFERLFDRREGLCSSDISSLPASAPRRFHELLKGAFSSYDLNDRHDFALIPSGESRKPLLARAIPLSRKSTEIFWGSLPTQKQVLLLVADLDAEATSTSEKALKGLGLTAAEAKVAALVGSGRTPRETALRLGTTEGTVRTQLKQVFSKMELSRQPDLVRLVSRIMQLS